MFFVCRICGYKEPLNENATSCKNCTATFQDPKKFSLPNVKIKLLSENGKIPVKHKSDDIGFDMFSAEDVILDPLETKLVKTNIAIELPLCFEAQIRPRSGMGKKGIIITNSPGTVDTGYRGDCGVLMLNTTSVPYTINIGDRIAQMIITQKPPVEFELVQELSDTSRGANGFGSSGQ